MTNIDGTFTKVVDYGTPLTLDEKAEIAMKAARQRAEAIERFNAVQREQARQKAAETLPRVIAYQLEKASNGFPSFQLEVAKRYLRGDGVDVNTNLAVHWLRSACTNGESQASNILANLNLQNGQR